MVKKNIYELLKAQYYAGKVKPTLTKVKAELENDSKNLKLVLLACECLKRTKNIQEMSTYADKAIELNLENAEGYYFKGIALQQSKGKEQEALKCLNQALALEPENTKYLKSKASTHLFLFKDYHVPIQLAKKHGVKAEESLLKVIELTEQKKNPSYQDYLIVGDVYILINKGMKAKRSYMKAESAYLDADESKQDKNIYKDIVKAQRACAKFLDKVIED